MENNRRLVVLVCGFALAATAISLFTAPAPRPASSAPDAGEVERLINQLVNVSEPGFGYSANFTGSEFLPYDDTQQLHTLVFGATHRARSEALREIVEYGIDAIPSLLEHIGDEHKINMQPMSGMMWIEFSDEYDFNSRTRKNRPEGVNRDTFFGKEQHPNRHSLTVGDLCFVALGQIVNRSFSATRYQPSGGLVVSSPTYSKRLRDVIIADWSHLTRDDHRQLLIQDFKTPDHERRRIGAYLRLSLYYPETVEALVLEELAKPTIDVFEIEEFCRDTLYKTSDARRRQELYEEFIRAHGDAYAIGVKDQLFADLKFGTAPRELLMQLFDEPANVKSSDRPTVEIASKSERGRLIGALTHDPSRRIGDVVVQTFLDNRNDAYMARACLLCLANRGYGTFLVEQLDRINLAEKEVNPLHLAYLQSISRSKEPIVQDRLRDILVRTANDEYFMAALAGLDETDDALVLRSVRRILKGLPAETAQGASMLELVGERFPEQAADIYKQFLEPNSRQRAETMCNVLWYGHPLAPEILAPLLSDKRQLEGYILRTRVCDRAAEAISQAANGSDFNSEWTQERRDRAIELLKRFREK